MERAPGKAAGPAVPAPPHPHTASSYQETPRGSSKGELLRLPRPFSLQGFLFGFVGWFLVPTPKLSVGDFFFG